jgi:hypothetical protein
LAEHAIRLPNVIFLGRPAEHPFRAAVAESDYSLQRLTGDRAFGGVSKGRKTNVSMLEPGT